MQMRARGPFSTETINVNLLIEDASDTHQVFDSLTGLGSWTEALHGH